jgi:hypothetical protein
MPNDLNLIFIFSLKPDYFILCLKKQLHFKCTFHSANAENKGGYF